MPVAEIAVRPHHRTPLWRKLWALVAGSTLAIATGAVLATLTAFAVAWTVITLTSMLRS